MKACPQCQSQRFIQKFIGQSRINLVCAGCSKVLGIVVTPSWVRLEISWLLEDGRLSESNQNFLKRIARKKFSQLSDRELARLSRLQRGDHEVAT